MNGIKRGEAVERELSITCARVNPRFRFEFTDCLQSAK